MKPQTSVINPHYLICPICGKGKIISEDDVPPGEEMITLIKPGGKKKARWHIKCHVCKGQVGFLFQQVKRKTKYNLAQ